MLWEAGLAIFTTNGPLLNEQNSNNSPDMEKIKKKHEIFIWTQNVAVRLIAAGGLTEVSACCSKGEDITRVQEALEKRDMYACLVCLP